MTKLNMWMFEGTNPEESGGAPVFDVGAGDDDLSDLKYGNTQYRRLNLRAVYNLLSHAWAIKKPCLIMGLPGLGKSQIVKQWASTVFNRSNKIIDTVKHDFSRRTLLVCDAKQTFQTTTSNTTTQSTTPAGTVKDIVTMRDVAAHAEDYFTVFDLRAATVTPDDVSGIPNMLASQATIKKPGEGGMVTMDRPAWVVWVTNPRAAGVLFLDEINRADSRVMNSFLGILQERQAAEYPISEDIMVVAAANTGQLFSSATADIDHALINRCHSGVLECNVPEWLEYARDAGVHSTIIGYIESNPEALMISTEQLTKLAETDVYKGAPPPFPTPRSVRELSDQIISIQEDYKRIKAGKHNVGASEFKAIMGAARSMCGGDWADGYEEYIRELMKVPMTLSSLAAMPKSEFISKHTLRQIQAIAEHCVKMAVYLFEEAYIKKNQKVTQHLTDLLKVIGKLPSDLIATVTNRIYHSDPNDLIKTFISSGATNTDPDAVIAYKHIIAQLKTINQAEEAEKAEDNKEQI